MSSAFSKERRDEDFHHRIYEEISGGILYPVEKRRGEAFGGRAPEQYLAACRIHEEGRPPILRESYLWHRICAHSQARSNSRNSRPLQEAEKRRLASLRTTVPGSDACQANRGNRIP